MNKTHWELTRNDRTSVFDINATEVCVASTCGPDGSLVGNVVSHEEFLGGRYQDLIFKVFGKEVLAEMIAEVEAQAGASSNLK
jgi:hypothetical protein